MPSVPMGTFKEYDYEKKNALSAWIKENYKQIDTNKFVSVNGGSGELFSRQQLITRAAIEGIIARQWATLELSRLRAYPKNN